MISDLQQIEPELKQILYGCVEHVQATKAALYLPSSHDLTDKTFEVVTSYQFNDSQRKLVKSSDDLVDRLLIKRVPFFVNGVATDQRFSELLFRQGTDRLLAAPLFARGRLIGFIDMRDKAGKRPFDVPDLAAAQQIADGVIDLLGHKNLFGLAPLKLMEMPPQRMEPDPPERAIVRPSEPQVVVLKPRDLSAEAAKAIATAREIISKRQLAAAPPKRILSEQDFEVVRLLLPAALAIPGAVLACFSAIGHANNPQSIVAIATVTDDAMEMLQRHLQAWLTRKNHPLNTAPRPQLIYPFGIQVVPVSAAGISTILSAPVNAQVVEGLVLTVAFERTPEAQAQRGLHIFLRQIEQSVESAIAATVSRNDRQVVAEKLLEPDFNRYPDLVEHSRQVAEICQRFAIKLDLSPAQVETIRLAALVHDVGLRLLDYDRLYKRPNLTAEEMRALAEHPVVGAAIVEPLLGGEIAQAVLRHHERPDGKGYPSRLSGNQIPLSARIIAVVDAWVAMTSNMYQPSLSREESAARMQQGTGTQFDASLVARFLPALSEIGA